MTQRVEPDDEVRRYHSVWLGPPNYSLPFHARYSAYFMFAVIFTAIVVFKAVTPLDVGTPPVWEIAISILATSVIMSAVDHDRPPEAVAANIVQVLALRHVRTPHAVRPTIRRTKTTREPL